MKNFFGFYILYFVIAINILIGVNAFAENIKNTLAHRFASLRANEVNLRTGPGVRYPVELVFHRKGLPVKILSNYETWRLIGDWQGTKGWVHQSMLVNKRTLIITGKIRTLRKAPNSESQPIAQLEDRVIVDLDSCPLNISWCRVNIRGLSGWLRRAEVWGVGNNEVVK